MTKFAGTCSNRDSHGRRNLSTANPFSSKKKPKKQSCYDQSEKQKSGTSFADGFHSEFPFPFSHHFLIGFSKDIESEKEKEISIPSTVYLCLSIYWFDGFVTCYFLIVP